MLVLVLTICERRSIVRSAECGVRIGLRLAEFPLVESAPAESKI